MISMYSHDGPEKRIPSSAFEDWKPKFRGPSNSPKVTQLVSDRRGFKRTLAQSQSPFYNPSPPLRKRPSLPPPKPGKQLQAYHLPSTRWPTPFHPCHSQLESSLSHHPTPKNPIPIKKCFLTQRHPACETQQNTVFCLIYRYLCRTLKCQTFSLKSFHTLG